MTLKEARIKFSYLFAEKLLPKARELGFEYALDEITQHQGKGHMVGSLHYYGCAGDLIIYDINGTYLTVTENYRPLGEYWESLDPNCKWGGRFKDGNHFSYSPKELFGNKA
jgi:hypothetical protein